MTEPPADVPAATTEPPRLGFVLAGTLLVGGVLDLFCLLLLPFRLGGHLVPLAPVLVLAANALVGAGANWLAADRAPAQALVAVALVLSALAVLRGPGGDVLVTANLEGMYLLFVVAACLGAGMPLFRRGRPG
ncbi:MAG: hypothetical protein QOE05_2116 [Actinomycetota bacterium]|nr:hypothetical protein [Actinomycetota bacterium]